MMLALNPKPPKVMTSTHKTSSSRSASSKDREETKRTNRRTARRYRLLCAFTAKAVAKKINSSDATKLLMMKN